MDFPGFLSGIDTIFYGRLSYDQWGNYQPGVQASEAEKLVWGAVHSKKKYVFSSRERQDPSATFISSGLVENVAAIRQEEGKDIWLYGGAQLISSFLHLGLIDQYRLSVHPVVLGRGKPLFENLSKRINLELAGVNRFQSGVVQLIYEHK